MKSFLFHDYETYGLNTKKTRVSQFAAIRTDLDLNIIQEEMFNFYSLPPIDFIPSPEACLVTGITPHYIKNEGIDSYNDYELFHKIHNIFNEYGTCSLGYNTISFDDEISRNGFYRNLLPIYSREFSNQCSRWDILNLVREFSYLYPKDIIVPKDESGNLIFKLDTLAPANGFKENTYHDAFTDVKATIFLAKLIKDSHPDYWDFKVKNRMKNDIIQYIQKNKEDVFLYTHSTNGGTSKFVEPLFFIRAEGYPDKNSYIAIKLTDIDAIKSILAADEYTLKERLYMNNEELEENEMTRLPFVKVAANKSPILTLLSDVSKFGGEFDKDLEIIENNKKFILENKAEFFKRAGIAFKQEDFKNNSKNSDFKIYGGGFMSKHDEFESAKFHNNITNNNFITYFEKDMFDDPKLSDLSRKIILRNFSDDMIKNPNLLKTFVDFARKTRIVLANDGYDYELNYSDQEKQETNFNKNDKTVEFTFSEFRQLLPEMEEKLKQEGDQNKLSIFQDFKDSLNAQLNLLKEYISIPLNDDVNNKHSKIKP